MEASKRKAENGWFISCLINVSRENSRHAWISQKVSSIWPWLRYKWNKWRQESETGPGLWNTRLLWRHWLCQHAQTWQAERGLPIVFIHWAEVGDLDLEISNVHILDTANVIFIGKSRYFLLAGILPLKAQCPWADASRRSEGCEDPACWQKYVSSWND